MNTQSNDVVKTADLTSNEQHKAVKPIIVSRRRLLRAGVAGIPVMLTMAGVAPAIEGITVGSAASGMNYDGMSTVKRISQAPGAMGDDNLIWSNDGGFVYKKDDGDSYTANITPSISSKITSEVVALSFEKSGSDNKNVDIQLEMSSTQTYQIKLYLHKNGKFYVPADTNKSIAFTVGTGTSSTTATTSTEGVSDLTFTSEPTYSSPTIKLDDNWSEADGEYGGYKWYRANSSGSDQAVSMTFTVSGTMTCKYDSETYTWSGSQEFTFSNISVTTPSWYETPTT